MHNRLSHKVLTGTLVCLLLLLAACGGDNGSTRSATPTPVGDPNQLVTYTLGIPKEAIDAPQVGDVPGTTLMRVNVTFKTNEQALNQLGGNDQAQEGQTRDVASIANQIGISDATYQKIKAFFEVQDAKLTLGKLHTSLTIDAKAQTFANLLQTKFIYHELNGHKFFTPAKTEMQLPRIVVDNLEAVTGLDNYSLPPQRNSALTSQTSRQTAQRTTAADACTIDTTATGPVVPPQQVAHAYGLDQSWKKGWTGKGTTVDLIEFEAFNPGDVQQYFNCVSYQGNLKTVNVDTDAPTSGEGEATLDIEMVAGLAPGADIVVYQTALSQDTTYLDFWNYFLDQLDQIASDNANSKSLNVLSISWGASEKFVTPEVLKALQNRFRILYQTDHMTTFDASGDCAAYDSGQFGRLSVDVPANIPWVTSVGGTVLSVNDQGGRTSEVAWSSDQNKTKCRNAWGTGGGLSSYFKIPTWQTDSTVRGVKNSYTNGYRQVPDLSAVAQNLPIFLDGQWVPVGGTSAAAPIWAASLAVLNQGLLSQTHYYVYGPRIFYTVSSKSGSAHPYYDIQKGNNLHYPATAGWDFSTGLGVPNVVDLQKVLVQLLNNSKK